MYLEENHIMFIELITTHHMVSRIPNPNGLFFRQRNEKNSGKIRECSER